jgi:hypothetical protein
MRGRTARRIAMRALYRSWLLGIGMLCVFAGAAGSQAQQTRSGTDRPGSILMFPKVVRTGQRDTIVQITNTGNSINWVHCFYLSAPDGSGYCGAVDFELVLTRQQPTQWRVSQGRRVDPTDSFGSAGAGFDPGLIPPVPPGFQGALVCVEVDANGNPLGQNRLKGEVTIMDDSTGDVSKYNAIRRGSSLAEPQQPVGFRWHRIRDVPGLADAKFQSAWLAGPGHRETWATRI